MRIQEEFKSPMENIVELKGITMKITEEIRGNSNGNQRNTSPMQTRGI